MTSPLLFPALVHAHKFAYRRALPYRKDDLICEQPHESVCKECEQLIESRCNATKTDRCKPCANRHRKNVYRIICSGARIDRPEGFFLVTITAPGIDVLPWDKAVCNHLPSIECSGKIGCKADEFAVAIWNEQAKQNWSYFITYLRRELKAHVEFTAAWELQARGALHRHAPIYAPGISVKKMRAAVAICATRWGFGVQLKVDALLASSAVDFMKTAGYVASYVTKEIGSAKTFNRQTGEVRAGGLRSWSASRGWGLTMGRVKEDRRAWVLERVATAQADQRAQGALAPALWPVGGEAALDTEKEIYTNPP